MGAAAENGCGSDGFKGETKCEVKYGVTPWAVKFQTVLTKP